MCSPPAAPPVLLVMVLWTVHRRGRRGYKRDRRRGRRRPGRVGTRMACIIRIRVRGRGWRRHARGRGRWWRSRHWLGPMSLPARGGRREQRGDVRRRRRQRGRRCRGDSALRALDALDAVDDVCRLAVTRARDVMVSLTQAVSSNVLDGKSGQLTWPSQRSCTSSTRPLVTVFVRRSRVPSGRALNELECDENMRPSPPACAKNGSSNADASSLSARSNGEANSICSG